MILNHISQSPHPVILAGDFNDTPQSFMYNKIKNSGFCDAFQQAGHGLGTTYAGYVPLLRIDYNFAQKNYFRVLKHEVIDARMSDHYPQVSTFSIISTDL